MNTKKHLPQLIDGCASSTPLPIHPLAIEELGLHHPSVSIRENADIMICQWLPTQMQAEEITPSLPWPILEPYATRACHNLPQVLTSKYILGITPTIVQSIVGVFHWKDCLNQVFGSTSGRLDTYFITSQADVSLQEEGGRVFLI